MPASSKLLHPAMGLACWAVGGLALLQMDGALALANLAMALVITSVIATLWLPLWLTLACSGLAVLAFNWTFVPPRHTFVVDGAQNAVLLGAMWAVTWIVAALVARQRTAAGNAQRHARQAEQLRRFVEQLVVSTGAGTEGEVLRAALRELTGDDALLLLLPRGDESTFRLIGQPDENESAGLWHCARQGNAFGPHTGRDEGQPGWYLPLKGQEKRFGAVLLQGTEPASHDTLAQAQALCDQFALTLERTASVSEAALAREQTALQHITSTMLAALSHDYRTPLATILGAASSLNEQHDKLSPIQRQRLALTIEQEALQLSRLTDNALQLARLGTPGVQLQLDWELADDVVGVLMRNARQRGTAHRLRTRVEAGVTLIRCDAVLLLQLLENLVDNALKYSPPEALVELVVRRKARQIVFAVRDRGEGVPLAWRERIFDTFQRGPAGETADTARRGVGVGLAACRAIAEAHGGKLRYRARAHGGSSFEFWLPEITPPEAPVGEA
ncbi:MAG: DUF4118 domain-containing protein [Rubrivivax sp.]|nr:MAG: DUF4118 domain-containing protein [Rubrivivax sp.]